LRFVAKLVGNVSSHEVGFEQELPKFITVLKGCVKRSSAQFGFSFSHKIGVVTGSLVWEDQPLRLLDVGRLQSSCGNVMNAGSIPNFDHK
jgi:hypothetical protein